MNLSKILKLKRDAEARLQKQSPIQIYVGSGGTPSSGSGTVEGDTYITNETILNQITNIISNQNRELLTNGSLTDTELLFADGEVIYVEVS